MEREPVFFMNEGGVVTVTTTAKTLLRERVITLFYKVDSDLVRVVENYEGEEESHPLEIRLPVADRKELGLSEKAHWLILVLQESLARFRTKEVGVWPKEKAV
jgi:hypothetical protein